MGEDGGGGGSGGGGGGGGGGGSGMSVRRMQERENLRHIIQQWNANRLDLFEISEPNEDLEFHGVMRFYFQDSGQKVATKCIRVMSSANSRAVIETLVEKFRPDMRMLSIPEYALYEIHENGDERRLADDEKPLLVQLNWNKDDREGRFLLRRMDLYNLSGIPSEGNPAVVHTLPPHPTTPIPTREQPFTRKLSKREKKELKKAEKMRRANETNEADTSVAEKLYTELPETSFTRSISNPEAVMRRRRAQKLEKKLQQFRSKDGGPDTGGTLKIYGESLRPDVPYKTLLLSIRDNAHSVVREMLEKYGLYKEDPNNYCLVQTVAGNDEAYGGMSPQKEYILDDDECPLAILMNHHPSRGSIMFHVRRRPADYGPRKRKKKPVKGSGGGGGLGGDAHDHSRPHHPHFLPDRLPFLIELGPDGNELGGYGRQHQLHLNVTEVGTDRSTHTGGQSLQLFGPNIQPRHCVIAHTEGIVTVTPCSRDADTFVNGQRIYETTILQHGCVVRFGRIHNFRFVDPLQDDRVRQHHPMDKSGQEKAATGGPGEKMEAGGDTVSHAGSHSGSQAGSRNSRSSGHERPNRADQSFEGRGNYERYPPARDPILPAVLEFREESEDAFLHTITTDLDPTDVQFKLAPTYTLYMAARFRASTHYRPDLSPTERAHRLTEMLTKVAAMVQNVIHSRHGDPTSLAFWMANASELLHFLKQDRHICGYSLDAQDILAEAVQVAFRSLVECMETELSTSLPMFLEDRDDINEEEGSTAHVLSILSNTMALLRRCRVNAALTIQLFSQLFHFINMWVFNRIVADSHTNYCTRIWGIRLKRRLARIELWAEKQGLELAADCHLARLSQAAMLLHSQKSSPDDIATISSTCFKLNSLQLRALLEKYQTASDEPRIPQDLIDNVVAVAESTADGLAREDGREVKLKEEVDLQLPFLLPEDGYSCDIVRGVPSGLAEFLTPLQHAGLCRMNPQPSSSGYWTIYMHEQDVRVPPGPRSPSVMSNRSMSIPRGEPEIHVIQLQKSNNGMGLSIVATKGVNQDKLGIYIKSVVPGGAADQDGRLQAGDQLLTVDGKSLIGITQERAAEYMMETGPVVTLEVARQGAIYHGLATILSQPSPQANRASLRKMRPRAEEATRAAMTNSQSTPNMGGYNERLVDWNQPPRQHPLPPTTSHNSLLARSSPNLAAAAEGTDVNHLASASTNKPAYSQSKLSPLRASLPTLTSDNNNINNRNTITNTPPLYPPPLISVIPSERVEVGIEHRSLECTRSNPDLPKYTFTPPSETSSTSCNTSTPSSSSSSTSSSWRRRQQGMGHGAGCAAVRRGSGPPSLAVADNGINLSCHTHDDAKPWRSLVDVSFQRDGKTDLDPSTIDIPLPSSASSFGPTVHMLVSRTSYPLLPSRPPVGPSGDVKFKRRPTTLQQQMSIAPTIAQSSPSLLLVHSPPPTPPPSQAYPSQPHPAASAAPIGYPGGRHLSERDLPSKVLREHSQDPPTHPHQAPRMQSSKSVPSLNSDGGSSVVGGKAASLEVFNPSYSRTSSNTSLSQPPTSHVSHHQHHMQQQQHHQQQQQPPVRSRSIQNLSDGSYQGAVGRHPSNPSLVVEEERYYQNVNFHQGPQDPRMGSTRTRPAQPLPLGSPTSQGPTEQVRSDHIRPDPRGDHRPASAFMQREDMMSHRNDLQRPASQRDIRADAKMMEMTEEVRRREERMRLNGHTANPQQQRPGPHQPHHRVPNAYPTNSPFSADGYGGLQGFPSQQHPSYHPASSQPLSPQGPISGLQVPPQHHPHSQYPPGQSHGFPGKHPPPTAPKPKSQGLSQTPLSPEAPEKPSRQFGYDGIGPSYEGGPPRPPPPEDGYRDSPPPPPPPTSTHPLLQGSRPTSSVGYSSNQLPNKTAFNAASPWDREEKDRNDRRRREAVRHWRDEQISSLEALEVRTSQQDERLRTLRLEKEFQRRAEEALTNEDDDDEDEDDDEADDPNENENKDSSRQTLEPLIKEDSKPLSSVIQEPRMNGGGPVDDERARRVDEIRRKQQELEAASEVEERLLREAQRRQQEEQMRQKQQQAAPPQHLHYQHQHHASQRLDSLVATPFQPQYSNGPVNGMRGGGSHASYQEHGVGPDIRNRGESVVSVAQNSPVPPERGSSYSVMQQQTPSSASSNSRYKGTDTSSATIKRVQFSETPATVETHITYDSNANQEKTPQDPNNFINEAETLLNSSPTRSIGGTPGVIGAQEVYRDPRMRRLQQKQAEQAAAKNPGPEKLTFKEKMKMFAMETGEGETPKDKVKISRAQRDIEH